MSKWESEKEELERLINIEKVSYEEIGRRYGCSGANIKKAALRLGIKLPQRRKVNPSETFNKGTGKKYYCLNCGKEIKEISHSPKYCSHECANEHKYKEWIKRWKNGEESGCKGKTNTSNYIKKYLFKKYNSSCQICGWNKINEYTGNVPLQIHHIDGDCLNNKEENLQLLCPNCHSLTENYGSRNKNCTRIKYTSRDSQVVEDISLQN